MPDLKIVPFQEPMPQRTICLAWRPTRCGMMSVGNWRRLYAAWMAVLGV
ncbi:hypothetical protein NKJ75_07390 [Mesorhizobium sp. M0058]|nr:hypothetical protein [Mesorhizobium sp. L103C105A0]